MTSTIWLAYAEEHALTDPDRRIAGRQRRLRRAPEAVLPEPADVLGWLANQRASYRKLADARGRAFNALVDDREASPTDLPWPEPASTRPYGCPRW